MKISLGGKFVQGNEAIFGTEVSTKESFISTTQYLSTFKFQKSFFILIIE